MKPWSDFAGSTQEMAAAGSRLFASGLAFLATTSQAGRPRVHPFVPKIVKGALVAFVMDSSPKRKDLDERRYYAIHALPGEEDEEFYLTGIAVYRNTDIELRKAADLEMGYFTGTADEHHLLYEFLIDRALWTRWLDFGTTDHRPNYRKWRA